MSDRSPAGSKMASLLPKAEPISNAGGACEITYLTEKKPLCSSCEKGVRKSERNSTADTKVMEKKVGEEVLQELE